MSAVIHKAKKHYLKAIKIEALLLVFVSLALLLWKFDVGISLFAGGLASFLPHCIFVYWVFFKESAKNPTKMTAFYWGEGMKWLFAIVCIIASFTLIPNLNVLSFFAGYGAALVLNVLLPLMLNRT